MASGLSSWPRNSVRNSLHVFGPGLSVTVGAGANPHTFSLTHSYADDNPTGTSSDLDTISVSVVDDDTLSREFLVEAIAQLGYQPIEAKNGSEAMEQALKELPDLVLTGRPMGVDEAYGHGIVSRVVAPEALDDTAREMAEKIAASPAVTVKMARRVLRHLSEPDIRSSMAEEMIAQTFIAAD